MILMLELPHDACLGSSKSLGHFQLAEEVRALALASASMKDLLKLKSFLMTSSVIALALITCSTDQACWGVRNAIFQHLSTRTWGGVGCGPVASLAGMYASYIPSYISG